MTDVISPRASADGRTEWDKRRIARLGFLVGVGWTGRQIADDPVIATTSNNVHRQAQRFGLAFRDAPSGLNLPPTVSARFDAAAAKRGLTRDALIRALLVVAGSDAGLIDNILDDEVRT